MKTIVAKHPVLFMSGLMLGLVAGVAAGSYPDTTPEGLVRNKKAEADLVYIRPEAKFDGYTKFVLIEPEIAFRKDWKHDVNETRRQNRITDEDMQKMIATGKLMLVEEFAKKLAKNGYTLVKERGPDVLAIRTAIIELDIYAPDPDNSAGYWNVTYANGAGSATLFLELYDSVTGQLLARAYDHKADNSSVAGGRRTQETNLNDARWAFQEWAGLLVKGLERAKSAK